MLAVQENRNVFGALFLGQCRLGNLWIEIF